MIIGSIKFQDGLRTEFNLYWVYKVINTKSIEYVIAVEIPIPIIPKSNTTTKIVKQDIWTIKVAPKMYIIGLQIPSANKYIFL